MSARLAGLRIVATVEARMASSRLPGKILAPIQGQPMLALLVERLRRATRVNEIVIATTDTPPDAVVDDLARQLGVACYRGSEDDVLDRVVRAAQAAHADVIVEVTGDCPLIDPDVVDSVVGTYVADDGIDYVSNTLRPTFPRGLDVQVFSAALLEAVARETSDPADREHVSLFIYEHPERYRLCNVDSGLPASCAKLRLTVDTAEDLTLIREIYDALYPENPSFTLRDVLNLLERRPELSALNQHVVQRQARCASGATS